MPDGLRYMQYGLSVQLRRVMMQVRGKPRTGNYTPLLDDGDPVFVLLRQIYANLHYIGPLRPPVAGAHGYCGGIVLYLRKSSHTQHTADADGGKESPAQFYFKFVVQSVKYYVNIRNVYRSIYSIWQEFAL